VTHWWEIATEDQAGKPARQQAVAYYRHSAQDRQENSIPIQRDQVCEWADQHGVDIRRATRLRATPFLLCWGLPRWKITETRDREDRHLPLNHGDH